MLNVHGDSGDFTYEKEYGSTAIILASSSTFTYGEEECEHGHIFGKREYLYL